MDTFIFMLRKSDRQVTFLHVYHHSSITLVTMLAAQFDTSGDTFLPALLNSWIHVLMYGHYFLTSIGVKNAPWCVRTSKRASERARKRGREGARKGGDR